MIAMMGIRPFIGSTMRGLGGGKAEEENTNRVLSPEQIASELDGTVNMSLPMDALTHHLGGLTCLEGIANGMDKIHPTVQYTATNTQTLARQLSQR